MKPFENSLSLSLSEILSFQRRKNLIYHSHNSKSFHEIKVALLHYSMICILFYGIHYSMICHY